MSCTQLKNQINKITNESEILLKQIDQITVSKDKRKSSKYH